MVNAAERIMKSHDCANSLIFFGLTAVCLICFSLNAILCRFAIIVYGMDPLLYAAARCISGALMLAVLWSAISLAHSDTKSLAGQLKGQSSWTSAILIFCYMICYACGYANMPSATGILIQNSAVQATMIGWGVFSGLRPGKLQFTGLAIAFAGLAILILPGLASPPLANAALMATGGIAWGAYCMAGRNAPLPSIANAGNFIRASLLAFFLLLFSLPHDGFSPGQKKAWLCAALSGTVTSGLGYSLWYVLLPRLKVMGASITQLIVPPITGILGFILLDEAINTRLIVCGMIILGGIWLTLLKPAAEVGDSQKP